MPLKKNIGFLVNRTGMKMRLRIQRLFAEEGYPITTEHWGILQCLYKNDGLSQVELSDILEKDKPNITRILDVMEKNELVERISDPTDRRRFLIFLTKKSKEMEKALFKISNRCRKELVKGVSANELEGFINILNKINSNIK